MWFARETESECVCESERERGRGGMAIFVQKISFNCHATRLQPSLLILISDPFLLLLPIEVITRVKAVTHLSLHFSQLVRTALHRIHLPLAEKVVVA